jgi:hypothetical protein
MRLTFENKTNRFEITAPLNEGNWLCEIIAQIQVSSPVKYTISKLAEEFESKNLGSFQTFIKTQPWMELRKEALLIV